MLDVSRGRGQTEVARGRGPVKYTAAGPDEGGAEARAGARRPVDLPRTPADAAHRPWKGSPSDAGAHTGLGRGGASQGPGVPTQGDRATEDRPRPLHLGVACPRSDRGDRKVRPWTSRRAARGRSGEAPRGLS